MTSERQRAEERAWDERAAHAGGDVAAFEQTARGRHSTHDLLLVPLGIREGDIVLDCGCGEGDLSRAAAYRGARVVGFDISSGMVHRAQRVTDGWPVDLLRCAFEALPFRDRAFGAATGMFVLHHVDLAAAAPELARVLAPGARATYVETWQRNPLLRLARRLRGRFGIAQWGTDDERPLEPRDLAVLEAAGFRIRVSFPRFVFFQLADNNVFRRRWKWLTRLLAALDGLLGRLPFLRPFGYYCLLELERLPLGNVTGERGLSVRDTDGWGGQLRGRERRASR